MAVSDSLQIMHNIRHEFSNALLVARHTMMKIYQTAPPAADGQTCRIRSATLIYTVHESGGASDICRERSSYGIGLEVRVLRRVLSVDG